MNGYSIFMSKNDDLAQRYLELWSKNILSITSDPQTLDALSKAFTAAEDNTRDFDFAAMLPWFQMFQVKDPSSNVTTKGASDLDAVFRACTGQSPPEKAAPGTKATAPSFNDGAGSLCKLKRRVTSLEKRIAHLESEVKRSRGKTSRGTAKTKP